MQEMDQEPVVVSTYTGNNDAPQSSDLRELLSARQRESESGPSRMFSAREAGVEVPPDRTEPELPQGSETIAVDKAAD